MKHRVKAFLLAACMTASLFTAGVSGVAAESETASEATEAVTEEKTEAATEKAAETEEKATEKAEETEAEATEKAEETEVSSEAETEAATESAAEASAEAAAAVELDFDEEGKYVSQYSSLKIQDVMLIETISKLDEAGRASVLESDDDFAVATMESFEASVEDLGEYQQVNKVKIKEDGDDITMTADVQYADHTATVVTMLNMKEKVFTEMTWTVNYSLGENMARAGMNTVMGIGIVFLVLLFLSFLISLFKYIPGAGTQQKKAAAPAPAAPVAAPVVEEEEDLTDDLELVAVITAAIAASEGTSSDGFVVRSIKKSNRRWQRA